MAIRIRPTPGRNQARLNALATLRYIRKLAFVGAGDVMRNRWWPALSSSERRFADLLVLSLEERSPLTGYAHEYRQIDSDGMLPLEWLAARGLLDADTLWVVATPPDTHVRHAHALLTSGAATVAVEKPLGEGPEVRLLLPAPGEVSRVVPVVHKLWTSAVRGAQAELRRSPDWLLRVRHVRGSFFELAGFERRRVVENTLADIVYHLWAVLTSLYRAAGSDATLTIDQVATARHGADPSGCAVRPDAATASLTRGQVTRTDGVTVDYEIAQAKGAPSTSKGLWFYDAHGALVRHVDLEEGGTRPYERLLEALTSPTPQPFDHTVEDAVAVTLLAIEARAQAVDHGAYPFGGLPGFLAERIATWRDLEVSDAG